MHRRRRNEIIELTSGERYLNESLAESKLNISRYYIRKSLKEQIPTKNDYMFSYYHYGMDVDRLKETYLQNNVTRSKQWKILTKLTEFKSQHLTQT